MKLVYLHKLKSVTESLTLGKNAKNTAVLLLLDNIFSQLVLEYVSLLEQERVTPSPARKARHEIVNSHHLPRSLAPLQTQDTLHIQEHLPKQATVFHYYGLFPR